MAIELAKAYLPIIPSLQGVKGNLEKELAPIAKALGTTVGKDLGENAGKAASAGLGKALAVQLPKELGGAFKTLGKDLGSVTKGIVTDTLGGIDFVKPLRKPAQQISALMEKAAAAASKPIQKVTDATSKLAEAALKPGQNFISGFRSVEAAQSALTGRMGTFGGQVFKLSEVMKTPGRNFLDGFKNSAAAESAFTGRLGTLGGKVRTFSDTMARPANNFIQGLKSSAAAESIFTGRLGSLGGRVAQLGSSFTKFGGSVKQSFSSALGGISFGSLISRSEAAGKQAGSMITSALKTGVAGAGAAVAGIVGASLVKGFGRLTSIENAEAKLLGLGNSAESVTAIMDNALASVKGTAFGMDEAATTAASAVAAGIEPGMELERYLKLVGDAATIAGTDMASMGSIFNKVATSGKVQGDVFAQLSDAGIPVVKMLADVLGVSAEEVYKLGADGKISSEQFLEAMSSMEGAALKGGETTTGAFKNMNAALSRFGAALLEGIFPYIGPVFGKLTEWIDKGTNAVKPLAQAVSEWLVGALSDAYTWAQNLASAIAENWDVIGPLVAGLGASLTVWAGWSAAVKIAGFAMTGLSLGVKAVSAALAFATSPLGLVVLAVGALTAGVIWAYNNVSWFRDLVQAAWAQIQVAIGFVVDWWTGTAWPAIQTGLQILGQWFTWLWQSVIVPAWAAIVQIIQDAWATYIQPAFQAVWAFIQGTLAPIFIWLWQNIIVPAFTAIVAIAQWAWQNIIVPLFNFVVSVVRDVLAPIFTWLWNNIIVPAWNGIVLAIKVAWVAIELVFGLLLGFLKNILGPAFKWFWEHVIKPVWTWISDAIGKAGSFIAETVFPKIQGALDVLRDAFEKTKEGIGKIWEGLKEVVKAPIKFVVGTVINDGMIAGYNKLNDFWNGKDISPITLGFKVGGYTGDGPADQVAGLVHKGEFVLPKTATQALIRDKGMGFLESLRHYAGHPGGGAAAGPASHCKHCAQAAGAAVGHSTSASTAGAPPSGSSGIWGGFQAQIARAGKLYVPKQTFMGVNTEQVARAWMGRSAVQVIAGSGSPGISFHQGGQGTWGFNAGANIWMQPGVPQNMRLAVLIHELGHALSLHHTMSTGSIMHPIMRGPTWPSSLDYGSLVRAWGKPGEGVKTYDGGDGGGFDLLGAIAEKLVSPVKGLLASAREKHAGNGFAEIPLGIGEKMLDSLVEWVKNRDGDDGAALGVKPTLYDKGGIINRGIQVIDHQRSTPDYVLTERQWENMYKIAENSADNSKQINVTVTVQAPTTTPDTWGARAGEAIAWELSKIGV